MLKPKLRNLRSKVALFLFLLRRGRELAAPFYCHYQITRRCNFRCESCRVWREEYAKPELSIEGVRLLAKNLAAIGVKCVAITGGEPLLRRDLLETVRIFRDRGLIVRLQSNGFLLDEQHLAALLAAGISDVYISLDTLKPDRFATINGVPGRAAYDKVLEHIQQAAKIMPAYGAGLYLTAVLRPSNIDERDDLERFARDLGCCIGFYGMEIVETDDPMNIRASQSHLRLSREEQDALANAFADLRDRRKEGAMHLSVTPTLLDDYHRHFVSEKGAMRWACRAGDLYVEILPDGGVAVCNGAPALEGYDYRTLPALYADEGRKGLFARYRRECSGCICTRQLEYMVSDPRDLVSRATWYIKAMLRS